MYIPEMGMEGKLDSKGVSIYRKRSMRWLCFCMFSFFSFGSICEGGPIHKRDGSHLPQRDREFAEQLSIRQRKIFCGQFNCDQRESAIKYARGRGKDHCYTPDEAVRKVMEESGMSLAVKRRSELEEDRK